MLLLLYMAVGYWAAGRTIYANRIVIEFRPGAFFLRKCIIGFLFGWFLIPWAIIKCF